MLRISAVQPDLSATLQSIPPPSSASLFSAPTFSDQSIDPKTSQSFATLWSGPGQLLQWVIVISLCLDQSILIQAKRMCTGPWTGLGEPLTIHINRTFVKQEQCQCKFLRFVSWMQLFQTSVEIWWNGDFKASSGFLCLQKVKKVRFYSQRNRESVNRLRLIAH